MFVCVCVSMVSLFEADGDIDDMVGVGEKNTNTYTTVYFVAVRSGTKAERGKSLSRAVLSKRK